MNARFWMKKDVDRSKDFMFAIQKQLKTRRIFRNLESFVGGRIREGDYREIVTNRFTLIVMSALRRSDKENRKVDPHGSEGSSKDGDGDTSFQWSQFTTPFSHLMFLINDIKITERPTTQLPQL
ncbi:hypothetical protein Tco_0370116 [Tanacetum coccineum]